MRRCRRDGVPVMASPPSIGRLGPRGGGAYRGPSPGGPQGAAARAAQGSARAGEGRFRCSSCDEPVDRRDRQDLVAGAEDDVVVGVDVGDAAAVVHDDVHLAVGLDLADGPADEGAVGADRQVGQVDVPAGEVELLVDLPPGRRGDEGRRRDLGRRDGRQGERALDLLGERLVEEAEDDLRRRVQVAGRQAGVEVRQVVLGRQHHGAGPLHPGGLQRLGRPGVAADDRHLAVE